MSILNSASAKSVYRGYDYYKEGKVILHTQLSDFEYEGEVQGTNKTPYHVIINTKHSIVNTVLISFIILAMILTIIFSVIFGIFIYKYFITILIVAIVIGFYMGKHGMM